MAAARARGRVGGRPKKLADRKQLALAQALYDGGQTDVATICRALGISRATLYRYLDRRLERQLAIKASDKRYPVWAEEPGIER